LVVLLLAQGLVLFMVVLVLEFKAETLAKAL
jgi:hypothetical protein